MGATFRGRESVLGPTLSHILAAFTDEEIGVIKAWSCL